MNLYDFVAVILLGSAAFLGVVVITSEIILYLRNRNRP